MAAVCVCGGGGGGGVVCFKNLLFQKFLSGIPSECSVSKSLDLDQVRHFVGPD